MVQVDGLDISAFQVGYLPIVASFAQKLGLVEEIDGRIHGRMETSPGRVILAMVLDALTGRSPLFRIREYFEEKDVGLLLGEEIDLGRLGAHTMGRVLDRLYEHGTSKILTAIAVRAMKMTNIEETFVRFDTTSLRVWGTYDRVGEYDPFNIVHGYSKDKRPDLKQLVISLLSVKGGLPVCYSCEDGNSSDKKLNQDALRKVDAFFADEGVPTPDAYVADSALVTEDNLRLVGDTPFITRLSTSYNECKRAIHEAVEADDWTPIGVLAKTRPSPKRPPASYKAYATPVTLYDKTYRAIVYHSTAHDKRRHGRIDRKIKAERKELNATLKKLEKKRFACEEDALAAAKAYQRQGHLLTLDLEVRPYPRYGRGRPPKQRPRIPQRIEYGLSGSIVDNDEQLVPARQRAGCFVLLTQQGSELDEKKVLEAYKQQHAIEQNFRFLKDPIILDSLFVEKPSRIEALGLVMILALLIWRLLQMVMRQTLDHTDQTVPGWHNKPTDRPTCNMLISKFRGIVVLKINDTYRLSTKLSTGQKQYLQALRLPFDVFTTPPRGAPP